MQLQITYFKQRRHLMALNHKVHMPSHQDILSSRAAAACHLYAKTRLKWQTTKQSNRTILHPADQHHSMMSLLFPRSLLTSVVWPLIKIIMIKKTYFETIMIVSLCGGEEERAFGGSFRKQHCGWRFLQDWLCINNTVYPVCNTC